MFPFTVLIKSRSNRIGIPRALYFYTYPALWETFFREIGAEPILSNPTDIDTVERAVAVSESEHCLPNKLFDAHVAELTESVDMVFVPRTISMCKGYIACPKLGALPDAISADSSAQTDILVVDINENKQSLEKSLWEVGRKLKAEASSIRQASQKALTVMRKRRMATQEQVFVPAAPRFLVLGHPYVLLDPFISGGILKTLNRLVSNVEVMAFSEKMAPDSHILWCTSNKMFHKITGLHHDRYAGVIQIAVFNCGCDSMMIEIFRSVLKKKRIPYMVLILDEHSAQAGLDTRLEAFIDSIGW